MEVGEQALVSEMNKVLRRGYRKQLGGDAPVFEEHVDPAIAAPQPEIEVLGTEPQERDLLRMLLTYGHERVIVPFQNEDGSSEDEDISVAELMFQSLAQDDITFDEPVFQAIYRDYSFAHKMGESVEASRYTMNADEQWRDLSIDLLTDRYLLSPNWLDKHKIHVTHEHERAGREGAVAEARGERRHRGEVGGGVVHREPAGHVHEEVAGEDLEPDLLLQHRREEGDPVRVDPERGAPRRAVAGGRHQRLHLHEQGAGPVEHRGDRAPRRDVAPS